MSYAIIVLKLVVGLGILNVWLLRRNKATPFRGAQAKDMKEEFAVYGLPEWSVSVVGTFKVVFALMLIASIWYPPLTLVGSVGLGAFMLVAVAMHLKIHDSVKKTFPATAMLVFCGLLAANAVA